MTDEEAIYNCTGNPHPADIDEIMRSMMNDSFETSYNRASLPRLALRSPLTSLGGTDISSLKINKGLALQDILAGVYDYIATVEFAPQTRVYLLDQLGQVEFVPLPSLATLVLLTKSSNEQAPPLDRRLGETAIDGAARRDQDVRPPLTSHLAHHTR